MARGDFTFESRMVPLLLAYAKERGLDANALVKKYELPKDALAQPAGKSTVMTKISVLPAIAEELSVALKDPHVGLSIAAWSPRGAYGVVEFLARAGPTLRQAWGNVLRFNSILGPDNSFHLDTQAFVRGTGDSPSQTSKTADGCSGFSTNHFGLSFGLALCRKPEMSEECEFCRGNRKDPPGVHALCSSSPRGWFRQPRLRQSFGKIREHTQ